MDETPSWFPKLRETEYHRFDQSIPQEALVCAVTKPGLTKRPARHTFRHGFASHLVEAGYNIPAIRGVFGRDHLTTTMVCAHVLNRGGKGVNSPVGNL